jgi:hypothetical protein
VEAVDPCESGQSEVADAVGGLGEGGTGRRFTSRRERAPRAERAIPKPVADALKKADVTTARLRDLLDEHAVVLGWLNRSLQDVGARQYRWPLEGSAARKGLAAGALAISGTAGLSAEVECDLDGEVLDGALRFDSQRDAFLRVGVTGKLEGKASYRGLLARLGGEAAFLTSGAATVDNWFRHRRGETVFEAVTADLAAIQLPGAIAPERLRARLLPEAARGDARRAGGGVRGRHDDGRRSSADGGGGPHLPTSAQGASHVWAAPPARAGTAARRVAMPQEVRLTTLKIRSRPLQKRVSTVLTSAR